MGRRHEPDRMDDPPALPFRAIGLENKAPLGRGGAGDEIEVLAHGVIGLERVIEGDQTLFVRSDEVEESWRLYTPLLGSPVPVDPYPAGTWGPPGADGLLPEGVTRWATGD